MDLKQHLLRQMAFSHATFGPGTLGGPAKRSDCEGGRREVMWTRFWDMHSGGNRKLDWEYIFIETNRSTPEALRIFEKEFGRDPYNVTCDCCGEDYSVSDYITLEQATEYLREDKNQTMEQFLNREDVKVLYAQNDDKESIMLAALQKIAAIPNRELGSDWEEIEEARQIANEAIRLVTGEG